MSYFKKRRKKKGKEIDMTLTIQKLEEKQQYSSQEKWYRGSAELNWVASSARGRVKEECHFSQRIDNVKINSVGITITQLPSTLVALLQVNSTNVTI